MHKSLSFLLVALLFSSSGIPAQQPGPNQAQQSALSFEVATIKPAAPSPDGHNHINYPPGDRFSAQNVTLLMLLDWAYRLPRNQILDAPSWLGTTYFDIQAKLETADASPDLSDEEGRARKRRMVQALLGERCNLKLHQETRVLPAYDLLVAKGGSKLPGTTTSGRTVNTGRNHFDAQGLTSTMIAEQLSYLAGRVVVDKTNLPDRYDVKLQWTPDGAPTTDNSPTRSLHRHPGTTRPQARARQRACSSPGHRPHRPAGA